jgi:hypothetical protein
MMEFSQRIRREGANVTGEQTAATIMRDADWYETHGQGD